MTRSRLDDETATCPKHAIAAAMKDAKGRPFGDSTWTMWTKAIIYSNRHLTDGFVPTAVLVTLTSHTEPLHVAAALVAARISPDRSGLFDDRGDGGYWVHGFLDHGNASREKVLAMRKADADRKASRGKRGSAPDSGTVPVRNPSGIRLESKQDPDTLIGVGVGVGSVSGPEGVQGGHAVDVFPIAWPEHEPTDPSDRLTQLRVDWAHARGGMAGAPPDNLEQNSALERLYADARAHGVTWAAYPAKLREKLALWRESVEPRFFSSKPIGLANWLDRVRDEERREAAAEHESPVSLRKAIRP